MDGYEGQIVPFKRRSAQQSALLTDARPIKWPAQHYVPRIFSPGGGRKRAQKSRAPSPFAISGASGSRPGDPLPRPHPLMKGVPHTDRSMTYARAPRRDRGETLHLAWSPAPRSASYSLTRPPKGRPESHWHSTGSRRYRTSDSPIPRSSVTLYRFCARTEGPSAVRLELRQGALLSRPRYRGGHAACRRRRSRHVRGRCSVRCEASAVDARGRHLSRPLRGVCPSLALP